MPQSPVGETPQLEYYIITFIQNTCNQNSLIIVMMAGQLPVKDIAHKGNPSGLIKFSQTSV